MTTILPSALEHSVFRGQEYYLVVTRLENRALTPEEQLKVLSRIWGNDRDGFVFLPWIDGSARDGASRRKNYHEGRAYRWPREKSAILDHLNGHDGDDVYFAPSLFNGKRRIEEQADAERALWADLDPVNPRSLGDRRPTIAWESSPGRFQGIWLLNTQRQGASWAGHENHRLTIEIGADPSGWDTTQLLRVPGRPNHKPDYRKGDEPAPGKLLWLDGPRYTWSDFDDLPEIGQTNVQSDVDFMDEDMLAQIDRHTVWARVRLKCSKAVREYMAARSSEGSDRSDVLWQIQRDLADAGCTLIEMVALVRPTVWNKYSGRNDELKRLKIEAAKALAAMSTPDKDGVLEDVEDIQKPGIKWLDAVIAEGVPRPKWLVRNIWAKGTCGFISGAPKSYKSWMSIDLAISVATGTSFLSDPQHTVVGGPQPVLMLQEEDNLALMLYRLQQVLEAKAPDLFWHGQLSVVDGQVVWEGPKHQIPLALHVGTGFVASDEAWQSWLDETMADGKFALVTIDTLGTTAGDLDTDRASEVMGRMLKPLKTLSQKHNCSVAIVHHNKKGDGNKRAGQDMLGSVALHAWVESAIYVREKEISTTGVTTAFVERESKQANDYAFRVRVPLMRTHDDDTRTLWAPEVLSGWGRTDEGEHTPGDAHSASEAPTRRAAKKPRYSQIAFEMGQMGAKSRWMTPEQVANVKGESATTMKRQMDNAVKNGFLIEKDGKYKLPADGDDAADD